jgi:hypothetical protein
MEHEKEKREPLRVYPFVCTCGSHHFTIDWAMYTEMDGGPVFHCAECQRYVVPTEPMEYRA